MLAFLIVLGAVALDQLSKFFVRLLMNIGDSVALIPGVINLTYTENRGAAFGMLGDKRWVFIVSSTLAIAVLIWVLRKYGKRHNLLTVSLSLIAGGGIGNMIDRLFVNGVGGEKAVTDFFEFKFVKFAIFNVADSFITIGAVCLGVYIVFFEKKVEEKLKAKAFPEPENPDGGETSE